MDEKARVEEAANEWKGLVEKMKEFLGKILKNSKVDMERKFAEIMGAKIREVNKKII